MQEANKAEVGTWSQTHEYRERMSIWDVGIERKEQGKHMDEQRREKRERSQSQKRARTCCGNIAHSTKSSGYTHQVTAVVLCWARYLAACSELGVTRLPCPSEAFCFQVSGAEASEYCRWFSGGRPLLTTSSNQKLKPRK